MLRAGTQDYRNIGDAPLAERVGFEPTRACALSIFETDALVQAMRPLRIYIYYMQLRRFIFRISRCGGIFFNEESWLNRFVCRRLWCGLLSYTAIWAQAEQGSPARANRGKEENNMARFRGWRQRRASNPQARRPPVFRTDWHSHLPSLPYWKSWTPCAPLYLYYMHFLRFIFSGASRYLF